MPQLRRRNIIPKWIVQYPVLAYLMALGVVSVMYMSYTLPWYFVVFGIVVVLTFFPIGQQVVNITSVFRIYSEKVFEHRLFLMAIIPRVIFTLLLYHLFQLNYNDAFGIDNADAVYYDQMGRYVADLITKGDFHFYDHLSVWSASDDISDMGYGIYTGFIYWATNNSIVVLRLIKCVWSSLTVLFLYRLAQRNFGEQTARLATVFCALWPNFWYYCTCNLKEVEMVFLVVLFVEQSDQMLRSRRFTTWKIVPVLIISAILFTFRTPLGLVALMALIFTVVISSPKVVTWGKRFIVGLLTVALVGIIAGDLIEERAYGLIEQVESGNQKTNMEWRSTREGGNVFAKYATSAVFAPMILTLPFPTMARPFDGQEIQQLNHAGNFIKNIISGFTILALIMLFITGKWREHLLPLSFMVGYLVILTMSSFAHSERFHQPVMPLEFMFAAYGVGIALTKKHFKRWFIYWCILMFIAAVAWNWFKMAGRGL